MNNERGPHTILIPIGALAGGDSASVVGPKLLRNAIILSAALVDSVSIPADDTDYVSALLSNTDDSVEYASGDTRAANQGALTAFRGLDLPLLAPVDPLQGGDDSGGPGVKQTIADKGQTLVVTVNSPGAAVLTAAALSLTMYYL